MLAIRRRQPGLPRLADFFSRDLGDFFGQGWPDVEAGAAGTFPVDIREDDDNFHVDADLPGFAKEEISVEMREGVLSITAERNDSRDEEQGRYHLCERSSMQLARRFNLGRGVDPEGVSAAMDNGVLHVTVAKAPEVKPARIAIQ